MDWRKFFLGLFDVRYNLSCFLGWWWCPALPSVGILFLNCKYYFTYCIETIVFEYVQASIQWVTKKRNIFERFEISNHSLKISRTFD